MRIGIFNVKGGVGKTALSLALYNDLKAEAYFSNEDNNIKNLEITPLVFKNNLEKRKLILPESSIFDFGGFSDDIADFIKICDVIVIPTTKDQLSIQKAFMSVKTIEKLNSNILLVMTKTLPKHNEMCERVIKLVNHANKHKWCYLNESKIFSDVIEENKGILELKDRFGYTNKQIVQQWQIFLDLLKAFKRG